MATHNHVISKAVALEIAAELKPIGYEVIRDAAHTIELKRKGGDSKVVFTFPTENKPSNDII